MKIMHEQIDFPGQSTLKIKWGKIPNFSYPWHYHNENEIVYIVEGSGIRFVGDHTGPFGPGELVMVAGNLPHYWRSDDKYYADNQEDQVNRLTLQFPRDLMKHSITAYPEFLPIRKLVERAERGIRFFPPESEQLGNRLLELTNQSGFQQIIGFLEILYQMAVNQHYTLLTSEGYQPGRHDYTDDRLQKVVRFLSYHYHQALTLNSVAEVAGMHPTAFCRYFKEKTGKVFSAYLNELRIGFACKLLIQGNLQVSQICFETGFNNLSNFNRAFKAVTGTTPSLYKSKFLM